MKRLFTAFAICALAALPGAAQSRPLRLQAAPASSVSPAVFFTPLGDWMICESPVVGAAVQAAILCPPSPYVQGTEPDYLRVAFRNSGATGFLYFLTGKTMAGTTKSVQGMVDRNDVNGSTGITINAGLIECSAIVIVEYSMNGGVFLMLASY